MIRVFFVVAFALLILGLQGCTCCAGFNHMFNAERAYQEGEALRLTRADTIPGDSSIAAGVERAKYIRTIEKGSRVLERFPEDTKHKPRAVYLIAESYRHQGEWSKAIQKYDEFERYFADHDSMPTAEYRRAQCLYRNREYSIARFALGRILQTGTGHRHYHEALELLARLDEHEDRPEEAIAALEKVLASGAGTPFLRGRMRLRLADLLFAQEQWERARGHYLGPEIAELALADRLSAALQSTECLHKMGRNREAAEELLAHAARPEFAPHLAQLRVRRGELLLLAGMVAAGEKELLEVAQLFPRTETAARAWFGLGDHAQTVQRNWPLAVERYDSCTATFASSLWGRQAQERRESLVRILESRQKQSQAGAAPISPREEFQLAELFLFRLSEVDSALAILDRLVEEPGGDSILSLRAAYARAFIQDEFKGDSLKADSLYRYVVDRYPGTEFAKQAQKNLGERVTVRTREDLAEVALKAAEERWESLRKVAVEDSEALEALFLQTLEGYADVAATWAGTQAAARAHLSRAYLLESEADKPDEARLEYEILSKQYAATPQGGVARTKLSPRLTISDTELERLRKRVEENERIFREQSERYRKEMEKVPERKIQQNDNEVLDTDYNNLYDFR